MRRFAGEGELGAGAVKLSAPFDELGDVVGAFLDEQGHRFRAAKPVARGERVLFVESNFVFIAEGDGDSALGPGGGGVTEIGFGKDQHRAGGTEFDGGAQASDARANHDVIGAIGFGSGAHGESWRGGIWAAAFTRPGVW